MGPVITWDAADDVGYSISVRGRLPALVQQVVGLGAAFAAIKDVGSGTTWGDADCG